jgi:hypothetical protein
MKAKYKAIELVEKYQFNGNMVDDIRMSEESAIECALICVDVILNDVGAKDWELDTGTNTNYWQEVKQEINKL